MSPRRTVSTLALSLVLALPAAVSAQDTIRDFESQAQRDRYYDLLEDLRCLVCQNQSLASSDADLAGDLRDEVYRLVVKEHRSNDAAIDFLVQRYGDFVLYRPPVQPSTWLLWFGPPLMLLLGGGALALVVRRRRADRQPELTPDEHARAQRLLSGDDEVS